MRRFQILRGQIQYKPELKDGEFFLDKTNHSLLIGDASVANGQFELAKQSAITNLQQQVDTKITADQAPVQSVNTKTGAVVLTAADVGALPDTTSIPTKTSELTNDSHFVDTTTLNNSLANKQNTITGGASTITDNNLTANRALVSNGSGKVAVSEITATELGYLDGVTSNIQTQIDGLDDSVLLGTVEGSAIEMPSSDDWNGVAYGNGKFVANAGYGVTAAYSNDGFNWTLITLPTDVETINFAGDRFFGTRKTSNNYAYSLDGVEWEIGNFGSSSVYNVYGVLYGNGRYVAIAANDRNIYSTDGINWTIETKTNWPSVSTRGYAYGNNRFVVFEGQGNYDIHYSMDGITWETISNTDLIGAFNLTYGNNRFVAVNENGTTYAYSEDGMSWTIKTNLPYGEYTSLCFGNGTFVTFGDYIKYSTDGGNTWKTATKPVSGNMWYSTYGDGKFISILKDSKSIIQSIDGITWTNKGASSYALTSTTGTDITSSVYSALEPYIPTPTVPTKTSELTNDSGYITQTDGVVQDGLVGMSLTGGFGIGTLQAPATDDVALFVNGNILIKNSDSGVTYIETKDDLLTLDNLKTPTSNSMATTKSYVDQYAPHAVLVTLTVAGWNSTSKTQTVTVSGILADESKQLIIPMPAVASMTAYNDAGIQCTGQAANSLTFTAETVPTAAISVYVTYQTVIS
nr:MAG TPA: Photosynthesis system II assembly factor YCF48 [Caudoviricetes sp.]